LITEIDMEGGYAPAVSLPQALAAKGHPPRAGVTRLFVEDFVEQRQGPVITTRFLIDYSLLETIASQRIMASNAKDLIDDADRLRGRTVLVGRGTYQKTSDTFIVPGRGEPVPGVLVQACATQTLLTAPLLELTAFGRLLADAIAALLILGVVLWIRLVYNRTTRSEVAAERLHGWLTAGMAGLIIVVGHTLVHYTRLMWTDFVLVLVALTLHAPAEHAAKTVDRWTRHGWSSIWRDEVFEKDHTDE
jgi:CHASE2 domain-containing sensor protein